MLPMFSTDQGGGSGVLSRCSVTLMALVHTTLGMAGTTLCTLPIISFWAFRSSGCFRRQRWRSRASSHIDAAGSSALQKLGVYALRSPRAFASGPLTGRFPFSMLFSWLRSKPWRLANALMLPSCSIAALSKRRTSLSSNMSALFPKLPLASNSVISLLSVIGAFVGITKRTP
jgi:hypothetical protein